MFNTPSRRSSFKHLNWKSTLPIIGEFLDFSSLITTKEVCKEWGNAFVGRKIVHAALSHLFGIGCAKAVMEIGYQATDPREDTKKVAIITPEKDIRCSLPVWSTLCDHIISLRSRVAQSNSITTSLALAICREWMTVLIGLNLPPDVTSDEAFDVCSCPNLVAITCVSLAIKIEEGTDILSLPLWTIANHDGENVNRIEVMRGEEIILRSLQMGLPVGHSGQFYFPLRIQLIGLDQDYRSYALSATNAPRRLSLERQKALLHFAQHALERANDVMGGGPFHERAMHPSKEGLVATVLCLAMTAAINNQWKAAQSASNASAESRQHGTPRLDSLKHCLVVALLSADVAGVAAAGEKGLDRPLLALDDMKHGFEALHEMLRELRRLQSHVLPTSHHSSMGLMRTRRAASSPASTLVREDSLLVHAWTAILASPPSLRSGQQPSPPVLSDESVAVVNTLCVIPSSDFVAMHAKIAACLQSTFRRILCGNDSSS